MLFHDTFFLFLFLPLVYGLYFILNQKLKIWFLIFSGFIFYAAWNIKLSPLILISILVNYFFSKSIIESLDKERKKIILIFSIFFNISYLGVFKYADFFISNFNFLTGLNISLLNLPFPLALSFVTFQTIAFVNDCYENNIKNFNLKRYSIFIIFFPQLIAGPIVRFNDMIAQFESKTNSFVNFKNIIIGLIILSIGIIKKSFYSR